MGSILQGILGARGPVFFFAAFSYEIRTKGGSLFFSAILIVYSAVRCGGRLIASVLGVLFLVEIWARWRLLGLLCHLWRPGVAKRCFFQVF